MAVRLCRLDVEGLRSLDGLALTLDPFTAVIGANGTGKSSTVLALQFLFGQADLDDHDATVGTADGDVVVCGTFDGIDGAWADRLAPWLDQHGRLVLARSRTGGAGGRPVLRWTARRTQVPAFAAFRAAHAAGALAEPLKALWAQARNAAPGLPAWASKAKALDALDAYESDHPDLPREASDDHSLGFGGGGPGDLDGLVELLVVPALRDAADDAADSRHSTLGRLVDLVVRSHVDFSDGLATLSDRTDREYADLVGASAGTRLDDLAEKINVQLGALAPGTAVTLSWSARPVALAAPTVRARIVESGHEGDIGRQGHGVQRAYVFSLLRALLDARRDGDGDRPGVVLVIEEPELYQHPVRARHLAAVLRGLAEDPDQRTQVVCTTHSPYFIAVDSVPSVRLLRMTEVDGPDGAIRRTRAAQSTADGLARRLESARGDGGTPWTAARVAGSLPGLLDSDVAEGLFADRVVLVEGAEDVGVISGAADALGSSFAGAGTALIAVGGKDPLGLAAALFRELGIPAYVVFDTDTRPGDGDDGGAGRANGRLTMIAGGERLPRPGTRVEAAWASANPDLRSVLEAEAGREKVTSAFEQARDRLGLPPSAAKNGAAWRDAVRALLADGADLPTLRAIVAAIASTPAASPPDERGSGSATA